MFAGTAEAESPVAGTPATEPRAGLVIRHGNDDLRFAVVAVPVGDDRFDGVDLLEGSGLALVTTDFGALGKAVCSIEGEGCGVGECRKTVCQSGGEDAPFWKFFRWDSAGEWTVMVLGASSVSVKPGEIYGWSWTAKGSKLPPVTLEMVAAEASRQESAAPDEPGQAWLNYAAAGALLLGLAIFVKFSGVRGRKPGAAA